MAEVIKNLKLEVYDLAQKRDLWVYGSVPGGAAILVELFNLFTSESLHSNSWPVLALALIAWHQPFWQAERLEGKRYGVLREIKVSGGQVDKEMIQAGRYSWIGFLAGDKSPMAQVVSFFRRDR